MSYPNEEFYKSKWKSIVNVLKSSNLKVSRIAQVGSRARRQHRPDSDMDIIFAASSNPTKASFYPDLIRILEANFRNDSVYPGSNYNVIHLDFSAGGNFDLVLLTEQEFDLEHRDILNYRRNNL